MDNSILADKLDGRSGVFTLAPGGFEAHENDIILTSSHQEKEIHLLERHGKDVTAAFLKSRLEGVLDEFYRVRAQKIIGWENALSGAYSRLGRELARSGPNVAKLQQAEREIEKLQQKILWARRIQSCQRDEIIRFLRNEARRTDIPFRATKFYKLETMRRAVMRVLVINQHKIDAQFTDRQGNPKSVGTQAGPFRSKFSNNIGVGYELNERMEIVEIPTLMQVAVLLVISDDKKHHYKVLTAYPEP